MNIVDEHCPDAATLHPDILHFRVAAFASAPSQDFLDPR
jgi:hypothetical protein